MAGHTVIETIEYLTQIHKAWDGTEQRMGLRENPRRTVSYRYTGVDDWHSSWMRALTYCKQGQQIEFPAWHHEIELPAKIWKGESRIKIPVTDIWGYRYCHAAMIWKNDEVGGKVFGIRDISASGLIRFTRQTLADLEAIINRLVPVFWGVVLQENDYTNEHTELADMVINVEMMPSIASIPIPVSVDEWNYERITIDIAKNADQYRDGFELFVYPPQWVDGENISYEINAERMDNESGMFTYVFKSKAPTPTRTLTYIAKTKEELYFLERFFYRCKGRLHSFLIPTWTEDLQLIENAFSGSNFLHVKLTIYYKYYASQSRRKDLIIFYNDGTIDFLRISGYSLSDDRKYGKVYLQSVLTKTIAINEVKLISFLTKARFNSDVMTINHETTSSAIIDFEVTEVDE